MRACVRRAALHRERLRERRAEEGRGIIPTATKDAETLRAVVGRQPGERHADGEPMIAESGVLPGVAGSLPFQYAELDPGDVRILHSASSTAPLQ